MKILRGGFLLLLSTFLFTSLLSSCCSDCFDDLEGSIHLKLSFDTTNLNKHFDLNRLDLLDSMYLIKTTKGNLNNHLDTIYNFEKEYFTRTHIFILNTDQGFDYILGNRDPYFRTEITEFESDVNVPRGRCNCAETKSLKFKIDSTQYSGINQSHIWVFKD